MEIKVTSLFGFTEIAELPSGIHTAQLSRTVIGGFVHLALDAVVLVVIDPEEKRIIYAHRSVIVTHLFQGVTQTFHGIAAA